MMKKVKSEVSFWFDEEHLLSMKSSAVKSGIKSTGKSANDDTYTKSIAALAEAEKEVLKDYDK